MILFLNKTDLLKQKLKKFQVKGYLPDYIGDNSFKDVIDYFFGKFRKVGPSVIHTTCATDIYQCEKLLNAVITSIIRRTLDSLV